MTDVGGVFTLFGTLGTICLTLWAAEHIDTWIRGAGRRWHR